MNAFLTSWFPLLFAPLLAASLTAQDWPGFRGPNGDGVSKSRGVPTVWSAEQNVRWKTRLARPANGSPIVSKGRIFLTQAEDDEGKKRSLCCFDLKNGKLLWTRTVRFDKKMPTHRTNPYGGSTPAANGERVVVWHASAGLHCYDFDGKLIWSRDFGEFSHRWGYGTSPVLYGGKVILHTGPGKQVFVVAVNLSDGETLWLTPEPVEGDGQDNDEKRYMGSWCTPIVVEVAGVMRVVCAMATRVVGYDLEKGEIVWFCRGMKGKQGDLSYSSPVVVDGICSVAAGYEGPEFGFRLGGDGDVTQTHRLWRHHSRPNNVGSGVVVGGMLYRPEERGFLVCLDPKTGEQLWSERPAKGQMWGSVVFADGRLFVMNQRGVTVVFEPNPEKLVVVARNELGERTNSTPAFVGSEVVLRTHEHLYCIGDESRGLSDPGKAKAGKTGN